MSFKDRRLPAAKQGYSFFYNWNIILANSRLARKSPKGNSNVKDFAISVLRGSVQAHEIRAAGLKNRICLGTKNSVFRKAAIPEIAKIED